MRRIVTAICASLLFVFTSAAYAKQAAQLHFHNQSHCTFTLSGNVSNQMKQWRLPDKIAPGETGEFLIEFKSALRAYGYGDYLVRCPKSVVEESFQLQARIYSNESIRAVYAVDNHFKLDQNAELLVQPDDRTQTRWGDIDVVISDHN